MQQVFYPTMVETAELDLSWIRDRAISDVAWSDPLPWEFFFDDGTRIMAFTPWRILRDGRIAISCDDHAQQYGLPAPVDAVARARELLTDGIVIGVAVHEGTLDLRVTFSSGALWRSFHSRADTRAGTSRVRDEGLWSRAAEESPLTRNEI